MSIINKTNAELYAEYMKNDGIFLEELANEASMYNIDLFATIRRQPSSTDGKTSFYKSADVVFNDNHIPLKDKPFISYFENKSPNTGINIPTLLIMHQTMDTVEIKSYDLLESKLKEIGSKIRAGEIEGFSKEETPEEKRKRIEERQKREEKLRKEREIKAKEDFERRRIESIKNKKEAQIEWSKSIVCSDSNLPYFNKKGINDIHNLIEMRRDVNSTVAKIPLYRIKENPNVGNIDENSIVSDITNFQKINLDSKILCTGVSSKGVFSILDSVNKNKTNMIKNAKNIYVLEGLATAYSAYKAFQGMGDRNDNIFVFALNSSNLNEVSINLKKLNKNANITIIADNDHFKKHHKNTGMSSAIKTSFDVGGKIVFPMFKKTDMVSDVDDFEKLYGIKTTTKILFENSDRNRYKNKIDLDKEHKDLNISKIMLRDLYLIKYSGIKNVWDNIKNFMLEDKNENYKNFYKKINLLKDFIPDVAYMKDAGKDHNGNHIYVQNGGKKFHELDLNNLIDKSFNVDTSKLEENTSLFIKEIKDFLIDNKKIINDYKKLNVNKNVESNENISIDNIDKNTNINIINALSNKEDRKGFMKKKGVLNKGEILKYRIKYPYKYNADVSCEIPKSLVVISDNKIFVKENNKEGNFEFSFKITMPRDTISEMIAIGDGSNKSIQELSKEQKRKIIYSGEFELNDLYINGRKVPDNYEISNAIKNTLFKSADKMLKEGSLNSSLEEVFIADKFIVSEFRPSKVNQVEKSYSP